MDILSLIKERRTVRKYKNKTIPLLIIEKIVEAGRWSSSVHGFQPWQFVAITNIETIYEIADVLLENSKKASTGINIFLRSTADTIRNAPLLIVVCNSGTLVNFAKKFNKAYTPLARLAEIEAIGGAIQNMILVAETLSIGSCWTTMPLFCRKELDTVIGINDEIFAIITFGFPAEMGKRLPRKALSDIFYHIS